MLDKALYWCTECEVADYNAEGRWIPETTRNEGIKNCMNILTLDPLAATLREMWRQLLRESVWSMVHGKLTLTCWVIFLYKYSPCCEKKIQKKSPIHCLCLRQKRIRRILMAAIFRVLYAWKSGEIARSNYHILFVVHARIPKDRNQQTRPKGTSGE